MTLIQIFWWVCISRKLLLVDIKFLFCFFRKWHYLWYNVTRNNFCQSIHVSLFSIYPWSTQTQLVEIDQGGYSLNASKWPSSLHHFYNIHFSDFGGGLLKKNWWRVYFFKNFQKKKEKKKKYWFKKKKWSDDVCVCSFVWFMSILRD